MKKMFLIILSLLIIPIYSNQISREKIKKDEIEKVIPVTAVAQNIMEFALQINTLYIVSLEDSYISGLLALYACLYGKNSLNPNFSSEIKAIYDAVRDNYPRAHTQFLHLDSFKKIFERLGIDAFHNIYVVPIRADHLDETVYIHPDISSEKSIGELREAHGTSCNIKFIDQDHYDLNFSNKNGHDVVIYMNSLRFSEALRNILFRKFTEFPDGMLLIVHNKLSQEILDLGYERIHSFKLPSTWNARTPVYVYKLKKPNKEAGKAKAE